MFDASDFVRCLEMVIDYKDDALGKRYAHKGTRIKWIITHEMHSPVYTLPWIRKHGIYRISTDRSNYFESLTHGLSHTEAGDIVIYFHDLDDITTEMVKDACKRTRRKLYEITWTKENGWGVIKKKEQPVTDTLF